MNLTLQTRDADGAVKMSPLEISSVRMAVVVVDIWTQHYCTGATDWPALMIPGWNQFLDACRLLGVQVVFASAGDDLKRWQGKPQRTRIERLPHSPMPASNGFLKDHGWYGPWPSGCMCYVSKVDAAGEPVIECHRQALISQQDPRIVVKDQDVFIAAGHYNPPDLPSAIASWGQPAQQELWNLCQARGITHLLYIGDATNMCVINREFGMIQARRLGLTPVIVRDLTNAMTFHGYNPETRKQDRNHVPAYGTRKAVEYIEQHIGPSIDSREIIGPAAQLPGSPIRQRNNRLPFGEFSGAKVYTFVEPVAVNEYHYAPESQYEAFDDLKYGLRLHWGLYTMQETDASWPMLMISDQELDAYQQLHKQWNPKHFDAERWMDDFERWGMKMFAITTKHHEGFSLWDTKTRVKQRINYAAPGGPAIEDCDLPYSVMDTPCKRDLIRELTDAARKRGIWIDLYFCHPDWYDADFRAYNYGPVQTCEGQTMFIPGEWDDIPNFQRPGVPRRILPNHTPEKRKRMMQRHRYQITELLTQYGEIQMMCLDQWLAANVWPELRETMIHARKLSPKTMFRARGIGNYGDYFTNEGFIPDQPQDTNMPSFVTYCLSYGSAYHANASHYQNAEWVIRNTIDTIAKGGNMMICIGPDRDGLWHPKAIEALDAAGEWMRVNGEAVYATRRRDGGKWKEGDHVRFTRSKDRRTVYAHCLQWPGRRLKLESVEPTPQTTVHLLGVDEPLVWRDANGVEIDVPLNLQDESNRPCQHAWVFKIGAVHE